MKKMLLIAIGLMFSCLSAKPLPDHLPMVNYEKITIQTPHSIFEAQGLFVENVVVSDLFVQPTKSVQRQTFNYVSNVSLIDLALVYQPILYERSDKINPVADYDIYKAKDKFKNEIVVDNSFRIQNVPKNFELV
ncbi:MAG: hypothetical protein H7Y10_12235 [Flavobacterium sp.]|nr:hypothetical protein [Flavobacterium sp.]